MSVYDGDSVSVLGIGDTFRHHALPDFELPLGPLFATALDLPK